MVEAVALGSIYDRAAGGGGGGVGGGAGEGGQGPGHGGRGHGPGVCVAKTTYAKPLPKWSQQLGINSTQLHATPAGTNLDTLLSHLTYGT